MAAAFFADAGFAAFAAGAFFAAFASAFVNWVADATGQTVEVGFDEDIVAAFVQDETNWSGSSATPISAVVMRGSRIARVTTVGQLLAGESLQLISLPDLAGNTSAAIAVDPHE